MNASRVERCGATLVELIVGLAVATIVVALATSFIVRHRRSYDSLAAAIDLRARLRDGSDIVTADLRGISPIGDSLFVVSDTAVEFYSAIGTSTVCLSPASNRITLPPDSMPGDRVLSSWAATPDTGDYVAVLDDSASSSPAVWRRFRIQAFTSVPSSSGCPVSAGLLSNGEIVAAGRSYDVIIDASVPLTAHHGAPVRIIRRVRYDVYRGGDGKWYIGYRRCSGGCVAVQPVSGPYESRSGPPVSFRYFTRTGVTVTAHGPTTDVGRIEIVSRANYVHPMRFPGMSTPLLSDSATVILALRN
jgi:hypothetical protein